MADDKIVNEDKITSFLVENLVWNTPNSSITGCLTWTETVKQTITFLNNAINDGKQKEWTEVSKMLNLFSGRKWTDQDVKRWLNDTWNYLWY